MRTRLAALLLAAVAPLPGAAAPVCAHLDHDGIGYSVCTADPAADDLRLFLKNAEGGIFGSFARVNQMLAPHGLTLAFAMNAGMYHPDRRPVGLYLENGRQEMHAVASAGPGNFGMLPNGVLCLGTDSARVIETHAYLETPPECRYATQSGPMLVIDGELHPRFLAESDSRFVRNGVGVDADGILHFAISDDPVTFHEFARLFRDVLKTPNALYLDGKVSKLFSRDLDRDDVGLPMGPIVGAVVPLPASE